MQPILKRLPLFMIRTGLCAAIALGLTTGSVLAHDDKGSHDGYDHSGKPHETPHKAEPPGGGHANLAAAATNPIANLVQFQLQNAYNWDNSNSDGYSNAFLLQPVVPFKLSSKKVPLLITRTTLPFVSTPDLGSPTHRKHGIGDLVSLGFFLPKTGLEKQMIGLGWSATIPTAGDNDFTGSGKWQIGPSAIYFNIKSPTIQWGVMGWHTFTVGETSSGSDKNNVTTSSIQPVLIKHFNKGWYTGIQDVTWNYNHDTENWTLPIGPRLGRVMKVGKQPVNFFGGVYYNPADDGPSAKWTAKFNMTLLFPK